MVIGRHRVGEAIAAHSVVSHLGCNINVEEVQRLRRGRRYISVLVTGS